MAVNLPDDLDLSEMETEKGMPMLECDCDRWGCNGGATRDGKCSNCDGTGRQLTAFGELILEFVRKHLHPNSQGE